MEFKDLLLDIRIYTPTKQFHVNNYFIYNYNYNHL